MKNEREMPPLGGGSIDLSVIHAADAKNQDLGKAIERATIVAEAAPDKQPHKREALRAEAEKLGIELREGATSIEIRGAITAHGAAAKTAKPSAPAGNAAD